VAVVALAAGCYAGAGAQAAMSLIHRDSWKWVEMLGSGATYALVAVMVAGMQRLFLSRDERARRAMIQRALTAGELPSDAQPEPSRTTLAQTVGELRQVRWVTAALLLPIAGLVAAAAVVTNGNAPGVWVLAVALAAFVVVPLRWLSRRAERAEGLLARLDVA
jgi:hypothetical protein